MQPMAATQMPRNRGSFTACIRSSTPTRSSVFRPRTPGQQTTFEAVQAGEQILTNSGASIAHDQAGSRILQPISGQHSLATEGRLQRRRLVLRHCSA